LGKIFVEPHDRQKSKAFGTIEAMSDRRPGQEIAGRYVVEREIGRGGMGAVYAALDTRLGRRVALKTLTQDTSLAHRRRLEAEARAVASIDHPGIVTLFDVVEDAGETVLVMELVDGDSLRSIMNDRALSPEEVADVVCEVSEALMAAHAKGFVHRDVKPDNIMVRRDGRVALLDFGVAKVTSGNPASPTLGATGPETIVGTPSYLSPEQARGASVAPATDQFALAVTAYEMLARSLPWETTTPMLTIASIVSSEPKPLEGFDRGVRDVLARGLAKAPEARFSDVRELGAALSTALGVPPTTRRQRSIVPLPHDSARVPSAIETDKTLLASETTAAPPARPRHAPKIAVALAVVVACGAALFVMRRHRAPPPPAASPTLAIADIPADGTTDAHARAMFRDAMRSMSIGRGDVPVMALLDEAIRADPEFAAAELQRAIVSFRRSGALDVGGRHAYLAALEHQAKLDPRDAELLRALGPSFTDPPDWRESGKRLEAMLAHRPGDAQAWEALGILRFKLSDLDAAEDALQHEQTVDPGAYTPYFLRGHLRVNHADIAGARRLFSECIDRVPATIQCRGALVWIDRMGGECTTADHVAREMVVLAPDLSLGYAQRAETTAALDAPRETLRELLAQKRAHETIQSPAEQADDESAVALRSGDFTTALAFLDAADAAEDGETTDQRGMRAVLRTSVLREIGDTKKAGDVAMAYLDRTMARALPEQPWQDRTGTLLSVAFEAGRLTHADYVKRRDDWVQSWRARLDPAGWQHDGLVIWIGAYANAKPSPAGAEEALAALPAFGAHDLDRNDTSVHEHEPEMGALLLAAGRVDEAVRHLESATRWCRLVPFVSAWRSLGQARLARGDSQGACAAFAMVEKLWGHAKPASVTRDEARADAKRAGCTLTR
jgi:serine/threonine-protein kinase